jgi:Xaa-Pro aminopeptidase
MEAQSIVAYVIPTDDAHQVCGFVSGACFLHSELSHLAQSEYVAEQDQRRAFISGFDGSAGTRRLNVLALLTWDPESFSLSGLAIVTPTSALLWVDGRYYLHAEQQVFCRLLFGLISV